MTITGGGEVVGGGSAAYASGSGTVFTLVAGQYAVVTASVAPTSTLATIGVGSSTFYVTGHVTTTGDIGTNLIQILVPPSTACTYNAISSSGLNVTWTIFQNA